MNLLINALITGAVFAIAASGLVVTYSTSGVFNFAHGALGCSAPTSIGSRQRPPPLAAAPQGAVAGAVGVGHRVARRRPPHRRAAVSRRNPWAPRNLRDREARRSDLGVTAIIGLANWVWKPTGPTIQPFFGADHKVTLFGVVMLWHDLTILLVAVALALTLRVLLFRTRCPGSRCVWSSTIVRSSSSTAPDPTACRS